MSLSARIAIGPSPGVAALAIAATTGGFVVAGVTFAVCIPAAPMFVAVASVAGWASAIASILRRHRRSPRIVVSVSAHSDIGVDGGGDDRRWRLVEPTMMWRGFAVVALAECDTPSRPVFLRYPFFSADIAPPDRRLLSRFLLWSLRGGGAVGHP